MRAIWKGSINFGLVFIPIAVYPATREEKTSFKQLRKGDLSPIRYKKVAEADEKEVKAEDIVKGFEHEKGKYVVLSDEDFEQVKIESTNSIEITDFVEQAQINPKYFYKPYFLEPQKGGEKGYALLHRALVETQKLGIAKVAIRNREYLAAVKPDGFFLILELMHFAHEVLEPETLKSAEGPEVSPKELEMAKQLIDALASDWTPTKYEDGYQKALNEVIAAKLNQQPLAVPAAKAKGDMGADILSVLQASLARFEAPTKAGTATATKTARGKTTTAALVKKSRRV
jgi:DNA end-binding protein Ku